MIHITRFKGIAFCLIMLLATVISSSQMPQVQASSSSDALKKCASPGNFLACKGDPIAIVYYRCRYHPKTTTKPATCSKIKNRYFLHNGMALANLSPNEAATEMGHVKTWVGGTAIAQKWFICSYARVIKFIRSGPTDPIRREKCHSDTPSSSVLYWVRDLTKTTYKSPVFVQGKPIIVQMIPIAYRLGTANVVDGHDGVLVCHQSNGSPNCRTNISATSTPTTISGTLYFEHYAPRSASTTSPFRLRPIDDNTPPHETDQKIQMVNLRHLSYPVNPS